MHFAENKPPQTSTLLAIESGPAGVVQTLNIMRRLVKDGKKNVSVRQFAATLVNDLMQKDWTSEIRRLHNYVTHEIRYVKDIRGVETLHPADLVLSQGYGDCDDKSVLLASMLESIGHPTRFVAIGFEPGKFNHVYVETKIGARWIPLETTEPVGVGWQPKASIVKARLEVEN